MARRRRRLNAIVAAIIGRSNNNPPPTGDTWASLGYLAANANPMWDYNATVPYRNLAKSFRSFSTTYYAEETDVSLKTSGEDTGYPVNGSSFGSVFLTELQPAHAGVYQLSVKGNNPFINAGSGTLSSSTYNAGTNKTTATLTITSPTNTDLIALRWSNVQNFGELEVMQPGFSPGDTTLLTPAAQAHYSVFLELRCMDRLRVNDRTDANWPGTWAGKGDEPWAYQWSVRGAIEFCSAAGARPWLNVTAQATQAYMQSFIGEMVTYMIENAPFTIEYGNEVWNYGFNAYWDIMDAIHDASVANIACGQTDSRFRNDRRILSVQRVGTEVTITLNFNHGKTAGQQIYDASDSTEAIARGLRTLKASTTGMVLKYDHPTSGNTTGVVATSWWNSYVYLDPTNELVRPLTQFGQANQWDDPQMVKPRYEITKLRELYNAVVATGTQAQARIVKGVQLDGGVGWYYELPALGFAKEKYGDLDWLFNNGGGLFPAYYVRPRDAQDQDMDTVDQFFTEMEFQRADLQPQLLKWSNALRSFGQTHLGAYEGGPHNDQKPDANTATAVRSGHLDPRMKTFVQNLYSDWLNRGGKTFAYYYAGATRTFGGISTGTTNNNTWSMLEGTLANSPQQKYQAQVELADTEVDVAPLSGQTSGTVKFWNVHNSFANTYNAGNGQLTIRNDAHVPDFGVWICVSLSGSYVVTLEAGTSGGTNTDRATLTVNGVDQGATNVFLPNWAGGATPPGTAITRTCSLNKGLNFVQVKLGAAPRSGYVSLYQVTVTPA